MKMKKSLCIALALVFAIGMLAGCGGGGTTDETTADISAFVDNGEKLEIRWLGYAMLAGCQEGKPSELLLENEFNVEIKPVFAEYSKYTDSKNALLQSGDIPDLIYELDPMHLFADARDEYLFNVPYAAIEKYAPQLYKYINDNAPAAWAYSYYEGENYGMPNLNNGHMHSASAAFRKDWLDKVGMDVPTTVDELRDVLYAFVHDDPDGNGKNDTFGYAPPQPHYQNYFGEIFGAYGVLPFDWVEKDGEIIYGGFDENCETVLAILNEWFKDDIIYPAFIENDRESPALFNSGVVGYDSHLGYQDSALETGSHTMIKQLSPDAEIVYGPLVKGPEGKYGKRGWGYACHAVGFGANGDDAPVKITRILTMFEKMFTDPVFNAKVRAGEEGVTHTINKANTGKSVFVPAEENKGSLARQNGYQFEMAGPTFWSPIAPKTEDYYKYLSDPYLNFLSETQDDAAILTDIFYKVDIVPSAPTYMEDMRNNQMALMSKCIKGEVAADQYIEEFTKIWEGTGGAQMLEEARQQKDILDEIYGKIGLK